MMFHDRNNYFIARLTKSFAKGKCNQVNGFGSTTRKDNLFAFVRPQKFCYGLTSRFVRFGSFLTQVVNATMNIGI